MTSQEGRLSPYTVSFENGAERTFYQGHTYLMPNHGRNGKEYFRCANHYKQACKGRLNIDPRSGAVVVSVPHTCLPTAEPLTPGRRQGRRQRRTVPLSTTMTGVEDFPDDVPIARPVPVHPRPPRQGPWAIHGFDDDDASFDAGDGDGLTSNQDSSDDPYLSLQKSYIMQKMEIGKILKQKLQCEIDLLKKRFPQVAN